MDKETGNKEISEIEQIASAVMEKINQEIPIYRDVRDVSALRRKDVLIFFLGMGFAVMSVLAGYQFLRKPTLNTIIKTADGQRVVAINDREFGCGEPVELGKDNLTNDDKTYLANQFAKWIFGVYLPARDKQIEDALNLIDDKKFLKEYSAQLTGGQIQREKAEQWNAVWKAQKITVDSANPMIVRIIGNQELSRVENNLNKKSNIQYELTFELTTDSRRDDDDLRTGFRILHFNGVELNRNDEAS